MTSNDEPQVEEAQQTQEPEQKCEHQEDSAAAIGQLREIVFGQSQRQLQNSISALQDDINSQLSQFRAHHEKVTQQLNDALSQLRTDMLEALEKSNQHNQAQATALGQELDSAVKRLSSEIEMTDSSGKDDAEQLHQRIDSEVNQLNSQFTAQFEQTLAKLDAVTQELTTTKTDRKTLAKLLATVALNLEADNAEA